MSRKSKEELDIEHHIEELTNEELIMIGDANKYRYPQTYVEGVFLIWYQYGRPGGMKLHRLIDVEPKSGLRPTVQTLDNWIYSEDKTWQRKADLMDKEVARSIQRKAITEKAEMIARHADEAKHLQQTAMDWIRENIEDFTPASAVRLYFESARLEKESRGLDKLLENITDMSDEQLTEQVAKLLQGDEVSIDIIEALENYDLSSSKQKQEQKTKHEST